MRSKKKSFVGRFSLTNVMLQFLADVDAFSVSNTLFFDTVIHQLPSDKSIHRRENHIWSILIAIKLELIGSAYTCTIECREDVLK